MVGCEKVNFLLNAVFINFLKLNELNVKILPHIDPLGVS